MIGYTLEDYLIEKGDNIQSVKTLEQAVKHLLMFWGGKPLSYITEGTCNGYYRFRNELCKQRNDRDISNSTVGRELRVLRAAVNRDKDMGRISNPVKIFIRSEHYKSTKIPDRRDVIMLARASRGITRQYILIAYYTGARKGAVLDLRWCQVTNTHIDFNDPEKLSNKKRSHIPMHRKLKSFMRIWKKRGTQLGHVIHINQRPVKDIKKGFQTARDKSGVDVTPYSLRHAAAVQMLTNGVNVYDVARWLGNSVDMVEKHYGHYRPDHFRRALEAWG